MAPRDYSPVVMIPSKRYGDAIVKPCDVQSVVAHRVRDQNEEYLVRWKWEGLRDQTPYSWHPVHELAGADGLHKSSEDSCLRILQLYLEDVQKKTSLLQRERPLKRRYPDDHGYRMSPSDRSRASSSDQSDASFEPRDLRNTYNCELEVSGRVIHMKSTSRLSINTSNFPTLSMQQRSLDSRYNIAAGKIRSQFIRGLENVSGPPVRLVNNRDTSTPSLSFQFIDGYKYRKGVEPPDPAAILGCGKARTQYGPTCRPNMGSNCGCEYTQSCECLEYARIDEGHEQDLMEATMGLPKRFPYSKGTNRLVKAYLDYRFPIYECNDNCACGPICKSRVVQKGRTVVLEVFKTKHRGWGLRAAEGLYRGQFIDTYRGEVITQKEAEKREETSGKGKDSYLFSLDKFEDQCPNGQHLYDIDGEFYGGPTRFINHSCEPNCAIYVVSRDKNNVFLYEIAFFALMDIPAGTELTFDYKDNDGTDPAQRENSEGVEEDSIPCKCGAANCRKWLWK